MVSTTEAIPAHRRVTRVSVMIAAVFLAAYAALGSQLIPTAMNNDFAGFYMGAKLFREGHRADLYTYKVQTEQWKKIVPPEKPITPYIRPPFYLVAQSLIALLPLRQSFIVVSTLSVLLLLVCLWGMAKLFGEEGLLLGSLFLPTVLAIVSGQDSILLLAVTLLSYWLYDRGRLELSGAALGLGLFKFHLFLLIGPMLLWTRRWRILAGFAVSATIEIALCFLVFGMQGVGAYVNMLLHRNMAKEDEAFFNTWAGSLQWMPNLKGMLFHAGLENPWTVGAGIVLVVLLCAIASRNAPWWLASTVATSGTLLIIPYVFAYDYSILLPGLLLCVTRSTSWLTRALAVWLCVPLSYAWNMFGTPWPAMLPLSVLLLLAALTWETTRIPLPSPLLRSANAA